MIATHKVINRIKRLIFKYASYSAIKEVSGTLGAKFSKSGLGILVSIYLARYLGAESFGVYAYAVSWAKISIVIGVSGLPVLLTRETSKLKDDKQWEEIKGVLIWSGIVFIISATTVTVGSIIIVDNIGALNTNERLAVYFSLPLIVLVGFLKIGKGVLRGVGEIFNAQVSPRVVFPASFLIFVVIGGEVFNIDVLQVVHARVLASLLGVASLLVILFYNIPSSIADLESEYRHKTWLSSIAPLFFINVSSVINSRVSIFILGSLGNTEAAGVYEIIRKFSMPVSFLLSAVNMSLGPRVSKLYAQGEEDELQKLVTKSVRAVIALALPIVIMVIIYRKEILSLFGEGFERGTSALVILVSGSLISCLVGSVGLLLNMTGHEKETATGIGVASIVAIMLNVILVPQFGLIGAAVSTSANIAVWNIFLAYRLYSSTGIQSTPIKFK